VPDTFVTWTSHLPTAGSGFPDARRTFQCLRLPEPLFAERPYFCDAVKYSKASERSVCRTCRQVDGFCGMFWLNRISAGVAFASSPCTLRKSSGGFSFFPSPLCVPSVLAFALTCHPAHPPPLPIFPTCPLTLVLSPILCSRKCRPFLLFFLRAVDHS